MTPPQPELLATAGDWQARRDAAANGADAIGTDVPVGVFVHGALCVAYSGQCLPSEVLGGRSANRGPCAQC